MKNVLLIVLILLTVSMLSCAQILTRKATITGNVNLSDNPASGDAGVLVSNGHLSTYTDHDGYFILEAKFISDDDFTVSLSKTGYATATRSVAVEHTSDDGSTGSSSDKDVVVDLGTIVLATIGS